MARLPKILQMIHVTFSVKSLFRAWGDLYYDESSNGSGNAGSEINVFLSHEVFLPFYNHQDRDTINPCNVIYTNIGITLAILDLRRYLPSQMSADGADNREYRVIRRIQKACTNCR